MSEWEAAVCASGVDCDLQVRTCVIGTMFYYMNSFMADHVISAVD